MAACLRRVPREQLGEALEEAQAQRAAVEQLTSTLVRTSEELDSQGKELQLQLVRHREGAHSTFKNVLVIGCTWHAA